jgi:dipeptidase D
MVAMLEHCAPQEVFNFFEMLSQIPRGSGNEKAVSDFILRFAQGRGLWARQDAQRNLVIKKPAAGLAGPTVILQGHLDMVCEKNHTSLHNFLTDPLRLTVDGDFIRAQGTTLGADNGIGAAMALALLAARNIPHPPLEVLLTTQEETGMEGAAALDVSDLDGKILLNLDSEEEHIFTTSCAGGLRATVRVPVARRPAPGRERYLVTVRGLKGGHSGMEIHKERGNANRLLARFLRACPDLLLHALSGGAKDNAIPREAEALVSFPPGQAQALQTLAAETQEAFSREYRVSDPALALTLSPAMPALPAEDPFTPETTQKILAALLLLPNGIQAMHLDLPGLVETSNNIGVLRQQPDAVEIVCALRSSVISRKYFLLEQIRTAAALVGATVHTRGDYPAWEYNPDSAVTALAQGVYAKMRGKPPVVTAVHAGLECGLLAKKIPGLDMISFGPDIRDAHTPEERLSISSTGRVWEFLKKLLLELSTAGCDSL